MNLITCQHEWVEHCQRRYRCEPPVGYWFEDAHYPLSKKLGGVNTIPLWYPDHIVQGVLQTLEYNYPCIFTRNINELDILAKVYPEYVELYKQAERICKSYAGRLGAIAGVASENYKSSPAYRKVRRKGGEKAVKQKLGAFSEEGIRRRMKVRCTPVIVITIEGALTFESLTAAAKHFNVDRRTIGRWKSLPPQHRGIIQVSDAPK